MKKLSKIISEKENSVNGEKVYGISPHEFKHDVQHENPMDYDHVHQEGQEHLTGDISHIKKEHKSAIGQWTTPTYRDINDHLRSGNGGSHAEHLANRLTEAIGGHSLPNATFAYRGVHGKHADNLKKLQPGDVFKHEGFGSTTLDPRRSTHFAKGNDMMAIHMPKGSNALYSSHPKLNSWNAEREMTMQNGQNLMYHGSEMIHNVPEHNYSGQPTGRKVSVRMHHVTLVTEPKAAISLDRD
jgi:hypothetical protein